MASLAALASSRIPTYTRQLPSSRTPLSPPNASPRSLLSQSLAHRVEMTDYLGLRSSNCMAYAKNINGREVSFFGVVAAQLTPKITTGTAHVRGETEAKLKVAINGFGRIGRNFLRCWWHGRENSPLDVVVVNDFTGSVENASHLLKYDYILGTFEAEVKKLNSETITVDDKHIKVVSATDPLPHLWAKHDIDIVIEGTGGLIDRSNAEKHIQACAGKIIIPTPAKGAAIPTYVVGVNEDKYNHEGSKIVSNGSSTTNCLAPLVKVIDEEFGIVKGTITTTHSYTGGQRLLDEAAEGVSSVLPQLKGKFNGIALHIPTPNVSVVDLVVNVKKQGITAEDVNAAFRKAAEGPLNGILAVCDGPVVSAYFRCSHVSSTIDSSLSMVMGGDMVKVIAWYDNEWGYSQRILDLAHLIASKWPKPDPATEGYIWQYGEEGVA